MNPRTIFVIAVVMIAYDAVLHALAAVEPALWWIGHGIRLLAAVLSGGGRKQTLNVWRRL